MAIWKITNHHKKNAVERQFWTKDGITVTKDEGFRWGTWSCESDEKPDVDLNNPDGYDVMSTEYDWEMEDMNDGCWVEWTFPEDMSDEDREHVQDLWEEGWYDGMEDEGWINENTENWIYGPIQLTNVDTGEEFVGDDE